MGDEHFFVGIDPGKTTSICQFEGNKPYNAATFHKLVFDPFPDSVELMNALAVEMEDAIYVLERQWIRPGERAKNPAYDAYMQIYAILEFMNVYIVENRVWTPTPAEWKKALALDPKAKTSERKKASTKLANSLFNYGFEDHNEAEAFLLAKYGEMKYVEITR